MECSKLPERDYEEGGLVIAMRIAILEDDPDQLALISRWIGGGSHEVHGFLSGIEILQEASRKLFGMFVLDWEVPDLSGLDVLRRIRSKISTTVPVLFVTVRDSEEDIVRALNTGADDYMIKPVRQAETMARIGALLRRAYPPRAESHIVCSPYEIDMQAQIIRVDGRVVELAPKEFQVAAALFAHLEQLVSRQDLLTSVWGTSPDLDTRTVDTHVSTVRKKLGLRGEYGYRVAAIYNYGYRLKRLPPEVAQVFAQTSTTTLRLPGGQESGRV